MASSLVPRRLSRALLLAVLSALLTILPLPAQQDTPTAPITRQPPTAPQPLPPPPPYNPAIFQKPIPPAQLASLAQFNGAPANDLLRDKQFHKLLKDIIPGCTFHYGRDMSLDDALDLVLKGSRNPVEIRDGRFLSVSGQNGPYLGGRAFLWIDLQGGIGLGAFFFHPTNGEPTPTVAVFSRQVREDTLSLSQLPPDFARDLAQWSSQSRVPFLTTRYFITGANRRILLEHDEDFCSLPDGAVAPAGDSCEQMDADAADLDVTAADYLDGIHYATNGTAWTIDPDQTAWVQVRNNTCGTLADPLACRIRMSRERIVFIGRGRPGPPRFPRR